MASKPSTRGDEESTAVPERGRPPRDRKARRMSTRRVPRPLEVTVAHAERIGEFGEERCENRNDHQQVDQASLHWVLHLLSVRSERLAALPLPCDRGAQRLYLDRAAPRGRPVRPTPGRGDLRTKAGRMRSRPRRTPR